MGTRSMIGVVGEDRKVRAVYCHWDGYPSHNGVILRDHYKDWNKIAKILELGSLSSLGPEIGEKHNFDDQSKLVQEMCTFYGRDRGETGQEAKEYDSVEDFNQKMAESWCEWAYLWTLGGWWCSNEKNTANMWAKVDFWIKYDTDITDDPELPSVTLTAKELDALIENGGEPQTETPVTLD